MIYRDLLDSVLLVMKKLVEMYYGGTLQRDEFICHAATKIKFLKNVLEKEKETDKKVEIHRNIMVFSYLTHENEFLSYRMNSTDSGEFMA